MTRTPTLLANGVALLTFMSSGLCAQVEQSHKDWPRAPLWTSISRADESQIAIWPAQGGTRVARRLYGVALKPIATGDSIRQLLGDLKATIVAEYPIPDAYILRVPDPGGSADDVNRMLAQLRKYAIVRRAFAYSIDSTSANVRKDSGTAPAKRRP